MSESSSMNSSGRTALLQKLADLTGGRLYHDGQVQKAITDSLKNAGARYQLAYAAPLLDGKYHKLRVACSLEGVRIEVQQGYFAAHRSDR
jgi:hypothetical protein